MLPFTCTHCPPSIPLLILLLCSPEGMIAEVQRWPGAESLGDAKECLDFASAAWCRLFCRLRGAETLLEALLLHVEAVEQGQQQAEPAALAALQALHSLVRWAGGGCLPACLPSAGDGWCL